MYNTNVKRKNKRILYTTVSSVSIKNFSQNRTRQPDGTSRSLQK